MRPVSPMPPAQRPAATSAKAPQREVPLQAERALVVFGCPLDAKGKPTPALERRLQTALGAFNADPDALILVSGGQRGNHFPEGIGMRDWLVSRGVPASHVIVESQAYDTLENAEFSAPLLKEAGVKRATVITEEFHVNRAQALLEHALRNEGVDLELDGLAAPDLYDGFEKPAVQKWVRERFLLGQDRVRQSFLHLRQDLSIFD